jgi:hypothetical protein
MHLFSTLLAAHWLILRCGFTMITCLCLLLLCCQVSLLITMNVLADVLMDDKELKQQLMQQAGESNSSALHAYI